MLQFYLDLLNYLESINSGFFAANTYSPIIHIDRFRGQYLAGLTFDCPAIFLEMSADWTEAGVLCQNGTLTLRVHVVQRNLADSSNISLDRTTAMQTFQFTEAVHDALQGWNTTNVGNLLRRRTIPDVGYGGELVDIMEYTATIADDSTDRFKKYVLNDGNASVIMQGKNIVKKIPQTPVVPRQYIAPSDLTRILF